MLTSLFEIDSYLAAFGAGSAALSGLATYGSTRLKDKQDNKEIEAHLHSAVANGEMDDHNKQVDKLHKEIKKHNNELRIKHPDNTELHKHMDRVEKHVDSLRYKTFNDHTGRYSTIKHHVLKEYGEEVSMVGAGGLLSGLGVGHILAKRKNQKDIDAGTDRVIGQMHKIQAIHNGVNDSAKRDINKFHSKLKEKHKDNKELHDYTTHIENLYNTHLKNKKINSKY